MFVYKLTAPQQTEENYLWLNPPQHQSNIQILISDPRYKTNEFFFGCGKITPLRVSEHIWLRWLGLTAQPRASPWIFPEAHLSSRFSIKQVSWCKLLLLKSSEILWCAKEPGFSHTRTQDELYVVNVPFITVWLQVSLCLKTSCFSLTLWVLSLPPPAGARLMDARLSEPYLMNANRQSHDWSQPMELTDVSLSFIFNPV